VRRRVSCTVLKAGETGDWPPLASDLGAFTLDSRGDLPVSD